MILLAVTGLAGVCATGGERLGASGIVSRGGSTA